MNRRDDRGGGVRRRKTERAGWSIRKKSPRGPVGQTERKKASEKGGEGENSSLERILSYTIQVSSRTRHRKALKSSLKMTASLLALTGKGIRGSTSGVESGGGDCRQHAAQSMAIR